MVQGRIIGGVQCKWHALNYHETKTISLKRLQAVSDTLGRSIWQRTVLVLTHSNLVQTPAGTDYDGFATRRVRCLRRAVPAGRIMRPSLPAVLVENSDSCPLDKSGRRILPDSSLWIVELVTTLVDTSLRGRPYIYHPRKTRKPNNSFKWLIPFVAAGQVRWFWMQEQRSAKELSYYNLMWLMKFPWISHDIPGIWIRSIFHSESIPLISHSHTLTINLQYFLWKKVLQPILDSDYKNLQDLDERVWRVKAEDRQRLGIGPPLRPSKENAWRLEQVGVQMLWPPLDLTHTHIYIYISSHC